MRSVRSDDLNLGLGLSVKREVECRDSTLCVSKFLISRVKFERRSPRSYETPRDIPRKGSRAPIDWSSHYVTCVCLGASMCHETRIPNLAQVEIRS
jgi:hypothetical protein